MNKPDVTLRTWVVGENGYPVVSASAVTPDPGPGSQPGPIGEPIEVNIVFKDYAESNGWVVDEASGAGTYTTVTQNGVSIVAGGTEGAGDNGVYNSPKYYDWRFYQNRGGYLTISVPDGYQLQAVTFDYYEYKNGGLLLDPDGNQCLDEAEVTVSGQSAKFVVGNQGTATNGQARILGIKVKYVRWGVPETGSNKVASVNFDDYAPSKNWENGKDYSTVEVEDVTLTASCEEGAAANGVYYVGSDPTRDDWRFYQARKGGLTISVPAGHMLVRVKFTYTNKNDGVIMAPDGTTTVPSGTDFSISGQSVMFTVGGTENKGQARINEIEIEYK